MFDLVVIYGVHNCNRFASLSIEPAFPSLDNCDGSMALNDCPLDSFL